MILLLILFLMLGIPAILTIIGLSRLRTNRNVGKTLIILALIWFIVGAGICANLLLS